MKKILRFGFYCLYYPLTRVFLAFERKLSWKENRIWIDTIPKGVYTGIAFESHTNWVYGQGFFSGLLGYLFDRTDLKVLDFGCGMGRFAPVCQFFTRDGGKYVGVDIDRRTIDQCNEAYRQLKNCVFFLSRDQNAFYKNPDARTGEEVQADWPVANGSQDLLISISVFTHLQEAQSRRYFNKIHEVLAPGGLAIISFHVIRNHVNSNPAFNFTTPLTSGWFTSTPKCPENAIAVTSETVQNLIKDRFAVQKWLEGSSTGGKSSFFQDLLILKKI